MPRDFDNGANWTGPLGFPDDGTDTAVFALLAGYEVQFVDDVTNNNLEVRVGVVELDLFREPEPPFNPGEAFRYTLAIIGRFGTGNLEIIRGANMFGRNGFIGGNAGSSGAATVEGDWTNTGDLFVGLIGNGTMFLERLGDVSHGRATTLS